ncbi:hypothetical protein TWF281_002131 [Arthrobotrys megalospora]
MEVVVRVPFVYIVVFQIRFAQVSTPSFSGLHSTVTDITNPIPLPSTESLIIREMDVEFVRRIIDWIEVTTQESPGSHHAELPAAKRFCGARRFHQRASFLTPSPTASMIELVEDRDEIYCRPTGDDGDEQTPRQNSKKRQRVFPEGEVDALDLHSRSAPASIYSRGSSRSSVSLHSLSSRASKVSIDPAEGRVERTSSSTRAVRQQLAISTHLAVRFVSVPLLSRQMYRPPEHVTAIIRQFSEGGFNSGFIPLALKDQLAANSFEMFPDTIFVDEDMSHSQLDSLVRHVESAMDKAATAFLKSNDESKWYSIVEAMLEFQNYAPRLITEEPHIPVLTVEPAQTKRIRPHLFPTPGRTKKVDYSLFFNTENSEWASFYDSWRRSRIVRDRLLKISPFEDPSATNSMPCCMVEVKCPTGNYLEAQLQAAEASIAAIKNLLEIRPMADTPISEANPGEEPKPLEMLPFPCITVHGHDWSLHWVYLRDKAAIDVVGPIRMGGTATRLGSFMLVNVLARLRKWLEEDYGTWIRNWCNISVYSDEI